MKKKLLIPLIVAIIALSGTQAFAVYVAPVFVVFERNNSALITLNNRSNRTKVITFGWEDRYYKDGKITVLQEGETAEHYKPASPYMKYSPRRIIMKPKQSQTVRLILQRPKDMEPGEYRSHFKIMEENLQDAQAAAESDNQPGLSGRMIVNVDTNIPIFIRHGETDIDVTLTSAKFAADEQGPILQLSLDNNSTRTIYAGGRLACSNLEEDVILGGLRLYAERKTMDTRFLLQKKIEPSGCVDPVLKIIGIRDSHYVNKVIAEIPVQRNGF